MISAMKTVKQCVQATAFPQTSDPNPSESPTYDSLMHNHIHTSRMHHIRYYYLWVGSALRAMFAQFLIMNCINKQRGQLHLSIFCTSAVLLVATRCCRPAGS